MTGAVAVHVLRGRGRRVVRQGHAQVIRPPSCTAFVAPAALPAARIIHKHLKEVNELVYPVADLAQILSGGPNIE